MKEKEPSEKIEGLREMLEGRGVVFDKINFLTYRCTRCDHKWLEVHHYCADESIPCPLGCSNPPLVFRLIRILKHEKIEGYGELIKIETVTEKRFKGPDEMKSHKG